MCQPQEAIGTAVNVEEIRRHFRVISTTSRRPPPELLSCRHGAERGLNPESPGNLGLGPVPAAEVEVDRVPELLAS